jgi:hypothetical protein
VNRQVSRGEPALLPGLELALRADLGRGGLISCRAGLVAASFSVGGAEVGWAGELCARLLATIVISGERTVDPSISLRCDRDDDCVGLRGIACPDTGT